MDKKTVELAKRKRESVAGVEARDVIVAGAELAELSDAVIAADTQITSLESQLAATAKTGAKPVGDNK